MKYLLWFLRIALGLFFLAILYTFIILLRPGLSPFQPTVAGNIAVLASLVVAFGTLALAYATFEMIQTSNKAERRNRAERFLNEIITWIESNINFRLRFTTWEDERFLSELLNVVDSLQILYAKGVSLRRIISPEWPDLADSMKEVVEIIDKIVSALLDESLTPKEKHATSLLLRNKLIESLGNPSRIVDRLKAELLNS